MILEKMLLEKDQQESIELSIIIWDDLHKILLYFLFFIKY
jgi:hypothetical protein